MPMDLPPQALPAHEVQLVREVGVESRSAMAQSSNKNVTLGVCRPVPNVEGMPPIGGDHALDPVVLAVSEEALRGLDEQGRAALAKHYESARVTLLQKPLYGTLSTTAEVFPEPSSNSYFFNPKPGDMRKDRVVFLVEIGDYKIKVIYSIYPVPHGTGPETESEICGKRGALYKIAYSGAMNEKRLVFSIPAVF